MLNRCHKSLFLFYLILTCVAVIVDGYAVCGNPEYKAAEAKEAVDEIIDVFMQRRRSDWVWESLSTITAIQVAAPSKLFGRSKAIRTLQRIVKYAWEELEMIDVGEIIFAARSLCLDPRRIEGHDLLSHIHDSMSVFLVNESQALEPDHIIDFSLMLSTLCLTSYPIDPRLVNGLMKLQNADGSFGPEEHGADVTISMLRPVFCLSRMSSTEFNTTEVGLAVRRMRQYLKTQVAKPHPKSLQVFIGPDVITTTNALVGLFKSMEAGEDPNKEWRCREVMDSLGLKLIDTEDEYDLQERILRVTATDYLDMQGPDYKCLDSKDLDPIPIGYKPNCDYDEPETCGLSPSKPK